MDLPRNSNFARNNIIGEKGRNSSTITVNNVDEEPLRHWLRRVHFYLLIAIASLAVAASCLVVFATLHPHAAQTAIYVLQEKIVVPLVFQQPSPTHDRKAFLTFLGRHQTDDPQSEDMYYIATRILVYQLMHAPSTKSAYPVIVAVTKDVEPLKRAQLEDDGAEVVEIPEVNAHWLPFDIRYRDMLTKLNIISLYGDYDRFCYMDADTLLLDNMDGIFDDPATKFQWTRQRRRETKDDEAELPSTYVFAGHPEHSGSHNNALRSYEDPNTAEYMNGGFVVFAPNQHVHTYYLDLVNITDGRWDHMWNEQNLWNYAHRRSGNMPWMRVADKWNVIGPTEDDVASGLKKSLHGHLWEDGLFGYSGRRHDLWMETRTEMEAFYADSLLLL